MGLFSSSTKRIAGTSVSRVIQDKYLPDSLQVGLINAIFGDGDIPGNVLQSMIRSIGVTAERAYRYGKDGYVFGLPSGSTYSDMDGVEEVEALLSQQEGGAVSVVYSRIGPPNYLHLAFQKLVAEYGYDTATNKVGSLSSQKGKEVFLQQIEIVVPDSLKETISTGAIEDWGFPPSYGKTPKIKKQFFDEYGWMTLSFYLPKVDLVSSVKAVVTYVWETSIGTGDAEVIEVRSESLDLFFDGFDEELDYIQVAYINQQGKYKYFTYQLGAGIYPQLDLLIDSPPEEIGTYFPFLYFRLKSKSLSANKESEEYKSSKKFAKYLGLDYDQLDEAIHENPDIRDVVQGMVVFAVPPETEDPLEKRYLFDFFEQQYYSRSHLPAAANISTYWNSLFGDKKIGKFSTVIQDKAFKMVLSHDGITRTVKVGRLGPLGSYHSTKRTRTSKREYVDSNGENQIEILNHFIHVFQFQKTEVLYEELEVIDLRLAYDIAGKHKYMTLGTGDDGKDILLVPIDHSITENYNIRDREELYARSLHFVFNSIIKIKVKWYEKDWFQFVLMVVAVVITVFSMGSDGGSLLSSIASLAGGTISLALINAIVMSVIETLIFNAVVEWLVEEIGAEWAMFLSVVLAAWGAYEGYNAGGLTKSTWAENLLNVSNSITKAISSVIQDAFADLTKEMNVFSQEVEKDLKLLEEAQELLEGNNLLSPFTIFGESPEDFYNRTVHSGNVGILGITSVSNFVDVALTLPKLPQTIGGF